MAPGDDQIVGGGGFECRLEPLPLRLRPRRVRWAGQLRAAKLAHDLAGARVAQVGVAREDNGVDVDELYGRVLIDRLREGVVVVGEFPALVEPGVRDLGRDVLRKTTRGASGVCIADRHHGRTTEP